MGVQVDLFAQRRQFLKKTLIPLGQKTRSRSLIIAGGRTEPVAYNFDDAFYIIPVRLNVLAGNIGDEFLVTIGFAVKNQAMLGAESLFTEIACAEKKTEFERHVEAGQGIIVIQFRPR